MTDLLCSSTIGKIVKFTMRDKSKRNEIFFEKNHFIVALTFFLSLHSGIMVLDLIPSV